MKFYKGKSKEHNIKKLKTNKRELIIAVSPENGQYSEVKDSYEKNSMEENKRTSDNIY